MREPEGYQGHKLRLNPSYPARRSSRITSLGLVPELMIRVASATGI